MAPTSFDVSFDEHSTATASPPKRLIHQPNPARVTSTAEIERAQKTALANRQRLFDQQRARCNEYITHVKTTAKVSREELHAAAELRRTEIENSWLEAETRRQEFLRAQRYRTISHRHGVVPRQRPPTAAQTDFEFRRLKAEKRRQQYLEERSLRAASLRAKAASSRKASSTSPAPVTPKQKRNCQPVPVAKNEPTLDEQRVAVARLQRVMRLISTRELLRDIGLSMACSLGFDDLTRIIAGTPAKRAAFRFICAVDYRSAGDTQLPRIFLTAFVVAYHPHHVLSANWLQNWNLVRCARLLAALVTSSAPTIRSLRAAWLSWHQKFQEWKTTDLSILKATLIEDALATENLRHSLVGRTFSDEERDAFNEQVQARLVQLRNSIRRLLGNAGVDELDLALDMQKNYANQQLAHDIMIDLDGLLQPSLMVDNDSIAVDSHDQSLVTDRWAALDSSVCEMQSKLNDLCRSSAVSMSPFFYRDASVEDINDGISQVAKCLQTVQAPEQDLDLHRWTEDNKARNTNGQHAIEDTIRSCSHRIDQVRTQVAHARIVLISPTIHQHGKAQERHAFEMAISKGKIQGLLPNTEAWLLNVYDRFPDLQVAITRGQAKALGTLVRHAVIDLLSSPTAVTPESSPELLQLDVRRLVEFQNSIQEMTIMASLDAMGHQFMCAKGRRSDTNLDLTQVKVVLRDKPADLMRELQLVFATAVRLALGDCELVECDRIQLFRIVSNLCRVDDATYRLINGRLFKFIREDVVTGSRISEKLLVAQGLRGTITEFRRVCNLTERIAEHLLDVHGVRVRTLAKRLKALSEAA